MDDTTLDTILGKRLKLRQPRKGHRAGTDAVLVAAAAPVKASECVVDFGAGVGTIGLAIGQRVLDARITLVEMDSYLANLAQENISLNEQNNRTRIVCRDVCSLGLPQTPEGDATSLAPHSIDHVVANPPFYPDTGRVSPDPRTAKARMNTEGLVESWVRSAVRLLRPGGTFTMIHRPDALAEILQAFERRFGDIAVLPVLPFAHEPAVRILVQGRAGSKAPLRLLPPLVLRTQEGEVTEDMDRLHKDADPLHLGAVSNHP